MGRAWKVVVAVAVVAGSGTAGVIVAVSGRAELPDAVTSVVLSVVISEVMTSNSATLLDEDDESSDWIEVWNRSSIAIDLTGWRLNDERKEAADDDSDDGWTFPPLVLAAGERVVVFTSGKSDRYSLHANFRLSADGEYVGLLDSRGREVTDYEIPALGTDVSYGLGSDGQVGILIEPTPGLPNSPAKAPTVAKPVLSRAGGYVDGDLSVTATTTTDDAKLWYTIDGSTPTVGHGAVYDGPISIGATTTLRMVATREGFSDSFVASATYLVMDDVLAQTGTPPGWSEEPVNGQVYEFGLDQEYVDQHRAEVAAALLAAPTLSVTTDLDNLISPTTGIYSNPLQPGREWERPASIELIDGDGGFQINGGIRIKGASTREAANPKHGFRLTFGASYEGRLEFPLFGSSGIQTFTSVSLRAEQHFGWQYGHERNTMMRDQFMRDSQSAAGVPSTRSRWVHLFLNGQYWGMYMLRDKVTASHAAQLWGGSPSDYDVLKQSEDLGYEIEDGDDDEWLQLWDAIEDGRLTDDEFATVTAHTDLTNLATFMVVSFATGQLDGAPAISKELLRANNWQAVRGDGQPFQFFLDDGEYSMGSANHDVQLRNSGPFPLMGDNEYWDAHHFNPGWLHEVLLTGDEYREIFRDRAVTLLGPDGALGSEASLVRWNELRTEMDRFIAAEAARWGYRNSQELGRPEWEAEVDWVSDVWLAERPNVLLQQLLADQILDG